MFSPLWEEWKWNTTNTVDTPTVFDPSLPEDSSESEPVVPRFRVNHAINERIYLQIGDAWKIPCDALFIGQNETLTEPTEGNEITIALAGPTVEAEMSLTAPVETGSSEMTTAGYLPCKHLIHCVGPKYDPRFESAADYALHSAYRKALILASENRLETLVITTIYKKNKKYPREDAAHVALRTIRHYLEHSIGDRFTRIMLSTNSDEDFQLYKRLMISYFPRNESEERQQLLRVSTANTDEWGETIRSERRLSVSVGPQPLPDAERLRRNNNSSNSSDGIHSSITMESVIESGNNKYSNCDGSGKVQPNWPRPKSFTDVSSEYDLARMKKVRDEFDQMSREAFLELKFSRMVDEAFVEDFSNVPVTDFLRFVGKDRVGNTVVCFTPALITESKMEKQRLILFLISQMERLRCTPFVMIYANSNMSETTAPSDDILHEINDLFFSRYKENLRQLYLLHANWTFRVYMSVALPITTNVFWKDYVNCDGLRALNSYIEVATLALPSIVTETDKVLFRDDVLLD